MCCYLHLSGTCNHVFAYDELQIGHIFDGKLLPGMAHVLSHSDLTIHIFCSVVILLICPIFF